MQVIKLEKLYYDNKWRIPNSKKKFIHQNYNNFKIQLINCNDKDVENSTIAASKSLELFKKISNSKKSKILQKISIIIKKNSFKLAELESIELGKNLESAQKEMLACANLWQHASKIIKKKKLKIIKKKNILLYELLEPIGVVALIIPWNFPMLVLSERLPYILAAGNSAVIKASEFGSLSINYFIKLIHKVGLPKGIISFLTGDHDTGKNISKDKNISMISFTGSTETGKKIYQISSSTIKRLSLELGGKNPMAVLSDANMQKAADDVIYSFTHNAGQCCVSGSRLFLQNDIKKKFLNIIKKKLGVKNNIQNIATKNQYLKVKKIIIKSIKKKIPIIFRNKKLFDDKKGIINPIIFKATKKNDILDKEIFGPVLTVDTFKNTNQLVKKMNDTKYGLAALIWTKNKNKAMDLALKLKSGRIWVNGNIAQNYPDLSIGGYKESGLNRETGEAGIKTYSEIKSIIVNS